MDGKHGIFGSLAGFSAAASTQPLDNIKMVLMIPPKNIRLSSNVLANFPIATKFLYRDGGLKAFYRGITPNLLKTTFCSSIFFSVLRMSEKANQQWGLISNSRYESFVSSMIGRIASVLLSNPLAIIETRYEFAGEGRWSGGLLPSLAKIYQTQGVSGYFKGALTSCYKEGIFAGLYYMFYQEGKSLGLAPLLAGLMSGVVSTFITHPFEIVRAELQSFALTEQGPTQGGIFRQIQTLVRSGETFRGVAPRLIKKPLTNTLAFLMFEMMEGQPKQ